ncbi:MAG: Uma2 family endonuclease [Chloroflexota bacterium]|nr:Uma2 family endonuclease [Chloroflexota bacterium]
MTTQELLEEDMAGGEHGEIAVILSSYLFAHIHPHKLGRIFDGQTVFVVGGKPARRQPDVAFVKLERMPARIEGEIPFAPDLAVEIVSLNDISTEIDRKTLQYQQAGVSLIWVVRPVLKFVEVYHSADVKPLLLGLNDELDGEDVIPGFKLKISTLFE